jgi:hypothetical protein
MLALLWLPVAGVTLLWSHRPAAKGVAARDGHRLLLPAHRLLRSCVWCRRTWLMGKTKANADGAARMDVEERMNERNGVQHGGLRDEGGTAAQYTKQHA